MDWQIRIALLVVGLVLVGYIVFDFSRKRKIQKDNEKLKRQFSNLENKVDSSGFDLDGVGAPRPASGQLEQNNVEALEQEKALKGTTVDVFLSEQLVQSEEDTTAQVLEPDSNVVVKNSQKQEGELFQTNAENVDTDAEPELVFSLILQATDGQSFKSRDFLPIFLSQGLRHGDMGIFHRHKNTGRKPGAVLFSLANAISPGTFSINNLDTFETPAFALFMTLPGPDDAQIAYDAMVKTVKLLKRELGGEILDETKAKYSEQIHNHRLDSIQEYLRKSN